MINYIFDQAASLKAKEWADSGNSKQSSSGINKLDVFALIPNLLDSAHMQLKPGMGLQELNIKGYLLDTEDKAFGKKISNEQATVKGLSSYNLKVNFFNKTISNTVLASSVLVATVALSSLCGLFISSTSTWLTLVHTALGVSSVALAVFVVAAIALTLIVNNLIERSPIKAKLLSLEIDKQGYDFEFFFASSGVLRKTADAFWFFQKTLSPVEQELESKKQTIAAQARNRELVVKTQATLESVIPSAKIAISSTWEKATWENLAKAANTVFSSVWSCPGRTKKAVSDHFLGTW